MARFLGCRMGAHERGAEAVEFALVLPVLLLLVFGTIDFGYAINRDTMVNNASREGAREGSLNPVANDIECTVRQSLSTVETPVLKTVTANCDPGSLLIRVTVTCLKPDLTGCVATESNSGGTVKVEVDYTHSWITPAGSLIQLVGHSSGAVPDDITLSKTTVMRIE